MSQTSTRFLIASVGIVFLGLLVFIGAQSALRSFGAASPAQVPGNTKLFTFFAATTTTATSTNTTDGSGVLNTTNAKKVTLFFSRGTDGVANTGSSRFSVEVATSTVAGTVWYDFNKLVQNVATSSNAWEIQYETLTGTSTKIDSMDIYYDGFNYVRCIADEVTDGAHGCAAWVEY